MQKVLKLNPIFQDRIWGGTMLNKHFGYELESNHIGECWAISAHRNGDCIIENGPLKGQPLSKIYREHRELFGDNLSPVFPLLTKILDASNDLSVQVHPNDEFAKKVENELGKTECWYIIDCEGDAEIIFGHTANSKEALSQMIDEGKWDELLQRVRIKPGDFFYVPSGTIHALCKGTLVLETQQSSDTTYRLYDYDRLDSDGNPRDLHIESAIQVSTIPSDVHIQTPDVREEQNMKITRYVSSKYFTVEKWEISNKTMKAISNFTLVSVLFGNGQIDDLDVKKGDHLIITSACNIVQLKGKLTLLTSWIDI